MILNPLQRLEVVKGVGRIRTSSVGYFVAQSSVASYNRWAMCIVFTRIGKSGKPRVEPSIISTRMIEYDNMPAGDYDILQNVAVEEGLDDTTIMNNSDYMQVKSIPPISKDLIGLSNKEFMGYITALSMLIHKLSERINVINLVAPYLMRRRRLDFYRSRFDLSLLKLDELGYYILAGIGYDRLVSNGDRVNRVGISFAESFTNQTDTVEKRREILGRMRQSFCMAREGMHIYRSQLEDNMFNVATRISNILNHYRKN